MSAVWRGIAEIALKCGLPVVPSRQVSSVTP